MMRHVARMSMLLSVLVIVGCKQEASGPQVVVIDLTRVAREIGRADMIEQQLARTRDQFAGTLRMAADQIRQEIEQQREDLGENPTDEQRVEFNRFVMDRQNRLRQEEANLNSRISEAQRQLVQQFRDEIRPYAEAVAAERGASIVFVRTDLILHCPSSNDITSEVIANYRAATTGAPGIAPAPALSTPPAPPAPPTLPAPESAPPTPAPSE